LTSKHETPTSEHGTSTFDLQHPSLEGEIWTSEHGTLTSKAETSSTASQKQAIEGETLTSVRVALLAIHGTLSLDLQQSWLKLQSCKPVSTHACEKPRSPVRLFLSTKKYPQSKRHLEAARTAPGD